MIHLLLAAVVLINDFKFQPSTITVTAGDSVRFENKDQEAHSVASTEASGKALNSPGIDTNGSWSVRLTKPGTYHYICGLHPFMTGTIVVVPAKGQKK